MTRQLTVSVVIPSHRRPLSLTRCLQGLQLQRVPPDEVLVAVRSADEDTAALVRGWRTERFAVQCVPVGEVNASAARNACIARAHGSIIAFIDDDAVAHRGWIAALLSRFASDPRIGAVGGPDWIDGVESSAAERTGPVGIVQWWGRRVGRHHLGADAVRDVEWLKGANMAVRRDAVRGSWFGRGLLGDAAQFAEDVVLSLRIRRAGWRVVYDPAVAVDHHPAPVASEHDHRRLLDTRSLHEAAHNEAVALLGYLPPARRVAFRVWSVAVGTRLLPGLLAATTQWSLLRGTAWQRYRTVVGGRLAGWRTWRALREQRQSGSDAASLRICIVTHVVHGGDGQGRVNLELVRWLVDRGHAVTVAATAIDPSLGSQVHWIRVPVPVGAPMPLQWLVFAWRARRQLGPNLTDRFDIVHLNGAITPVRADVNTSHFVHRRWTRVLPLVGGYAPRTLYQYLVTRACAAFERRAYRSAQAVVAVSELVQRSLREDVGLDHHATAVIPTGVDANEFRPRASNDQRALRSSCGLGEGDFVALFVGDARTPRKNLDLAMHVVARVNRAIHLAVVGNADGGSYPRLASQLGIADRVHFLGMRSDVAACYRDADVVFCASHYEPASLVLLEAMASGTPVITAPEIGNAMFVEHGRNGFMLRSSADIDGAVGAVELLAADAARGASIGAAARDTALTLSWDAMSERYETLYRRIADGVAA